MFASHSIFGRIAAPLTLAALFAAPSALAGTTVIDFDHDASGNLLNAPGLFSLGASLTNSYAALGVTFNGPGGVGSNTGGAILNGAKGGFPVPTHSGANFLCFKSGDYASGPETITFAQPASNVSIYAASPGSATFTMNGYNSAGVLVAASVASVSTSQDALGNYVFPWVKLSVNGNALGNISKVVLVETVPNPFLIIYHYDDLSFTTPTTSANVSGQLTLEGIAANALAKPFSFEFRPTDGSAAFVQTVQVGPNGAFILTGVPKKAYTLHIKGAHYLATNIGVDATAGDVSSANAGLSAGDINGDNRVDTLDFGLLVNVYGDSYNPVNPSAPSAALAADLNGDGTVDVLDFGLLVNNYGATGAN